MPDHRKHRGPHPEDKRLFDDEAVPRLRAAVHDLSWLLSRGYASVSATRLVGDRHALNSRQRLAVGRCACSDPAVRRRRQKQVTTRDLRNRELWIDGYNVLTSIEAALAGGVILQTRDGCCRDMASMHGSYRKVEETVPALRLLGECLESWDVAGCRWLLDRPVSNSGRLKAIMEDVSADRGWPWQVELVRNPDEELIPCQNIVASADSQILDECQRWFDLAGSAITIRVPNAWIINAGC